MKVEFSRAQCILDVTPADMTINCGQSVDFTAIGLSDVPALQTDFDGGQIGPGWSATGVVLYNNPCGPSLDGTPSAWFGGVPLPRILTTEPFDLACGGQVCFDLDFAGDENSTDCEDPDLTDEGVYFQYSVDGGTNWIDIFYFEPNSSQQGPYYSWAQYCFTLPPAAWTASTQFQWNQPNATDVNYDHWGIDNVIIIPSNCNFYYDWSNIPGSNDPNAQTVSPTQTTTYNVIYTDGADTCSQDITITVVEMIATATTSDNNVFCPDCADLNVEISNSEAGAIQDDFDPGIDPTMWGDIQNGTAGTGCGGVSGNGLHFDSNSGARYAATVPINATLCSSIDFCLFLGNSGSGGAPCENVDANENVIFEYSTNGGGTWITIQTYDQSAWDANNSWQCFSMPMPAGAMSLNTIFRWSQPAFSACSGCDNWSLDDVYIACAPPAFDYVWTPAVSLDDPSIQTPQACPLYPTIYNVLVTDPNSGCSASDTVLINAACGCTFFNMETTPSICQTGNVFAVNGSFTFVENPGGTIQVDLSNASTSISQTISDPLVDGQVYNYTFNNVPADGSAYTINVYFNDSTACAAQITGISPLPPNLLSIAGGDIYCPGEVVDSIFVEVEGNGPWSIDYTVDGVSLISTGSSSIIGLNNIDGVYNAYLITDAGGCTTNVSFTDSINIYLPPSVEVIDGGGIYCADDTVQNVFVVVTGTTPWSLDYTFNGSSMNIVSNSDTILLGTDEGLYEIQLISDLTCSTPVSGTDEIILNDLPPVYAGADFITCDGDLITLNGSGAIIYEWDNNVVDGVNFVPPVTQDYAVIGTDANGCQNTDTIHVIVESLPAVAFMSNELEGCEPLTVILTNTTPGNMVDCQWNFGDGESASDCDSLVHTFVYPGLYDVSLTTTSSNGCVNSVTYDDYIYVESEPIASYDASAYSVLNISPEVIFSNTSQGATTYWWDFDDGSEGTDAIHPLHEFPESNGGGYHVTLYAYSPLGCPDSTFSIIQVVEVIIFYVPNSFTPDDDEFNQTFQPVFTAGFDAYDVDFYIYNRWGELIFESHDVDQGWDGTYGGVLCQSGTYNWKLEFKTYENDERKLYTGHVNLLK